MNDRSKNGPTPKRVRRAVPPEYVRTELAGMAKVFLDDWEKADGTWMACEHAQRGGEVWGWLDEPRKVYCPACMDELKAAEADTLGKPDETCHTCRQLPDDGLLNTMSGRLGEINLYGRICDYCAGAKPTPARPIGDILRSLAGARIPGGCEHCHAYQVIPPGGLLTPGVHHVQVRHDDDCPALARMTTS